MRGSAIFSFVFSFDTTAPVYYQILGMKLGMVQKTSSQGLKWLWSLVVWVGSKPV